MEQDSEMTRCARELMNPELFQATADASAGDVLSRLVDLEISSCPVVREDGRLLGVVSLGALSLADRETAVSALASPPGMTVREDASVREIAELMADTSSHHVVVVTPVGYVVGIVSTIDVIRELCDIAPRWPDPYPHRDAQFDIAWTRDRPLDYARVHSAPSGAGLFSLICTGDRVIWTEFAESIRERLVEILAEPTIVNSAVCSALSDGDLHFRAAPLGDRAKGSHIVDTLQRLSGYASRLD